MNNIILASKSPRRKKLLELINLNFKVEIREVNEVFPKSLAIEKVSEYLAKLKAEAFTNINNNQIIITADTIVIQDKEILGKPKDKTEAKKMLQSLSNRDHIVMTGVCIKSKYNTISFSSTTKVFFKKLLSSEIEYYIENYKPFDKAGAYGIQEWIGAIGITKIEGCYFNVVGLPIQELNQQLINVFYNIVNNIKS